MKFSEIHLGQRFLHLEAREDRKREQDWYYWRKLDDTHARMSTPLGQDYGPPVTFFSTETVRPEL